MSKRKRERKHVAIIEGDVIYDYAAMLKLSPAELDRRTHAGTLPRLRGDVAVERCGSNETVKVG